MNKDLKSILLLGLGKVGSLVGVLLSKTGFQVVGADLQRKSGLSFETKTIDVSEGEFIIIPKGVVHKPVAEQEVHLMMFVSGTNVNTGDIENEFTLDTKSLEII